MPLLAALIPILLEAPQLLASAQKVWETIMGAHAIGLITVPADQLAALQKLSYQLDADIEAMIAARPLTPAAISPGMATFAAPAIVSPPLHITGAAAGAT